MYQVILRLVFIARHTRKATDHCFSFLYPRRDVHEVSVALYDFLCFEKLLLLLP